MDVSRCRFRVPARPRERIVVYPGAMLCVRCTRSRLSRGGSLQVSGSSHGGSLPSADLLRRQLGLQQPPLPPSWPLRNWPEQVTRPITNRVFNYIPPVIDYLKIVKVSAIYSMRFIRETVKLRTDVIAGHRNNLQIIIT